MLKQEFKQPPGIKILINIGALLDIPTGFFIKGRHGEHILLGGLGAITAVVGRGNRYKSTILHYMMLSAANRLMSTIDTSMSTYDTEINIHEHTLSRFISKFDFLRDKNLIPEGVWVITDKTIYYGNVWYEELKKFLKSKKDNIKKLMVNTPFLDRDGVTPMQIMIPTFSEIDSFSEFTTEDVVKIQEENELGDSGGNTIHMRQGLGKLRFLMEAPTLFGGTSHFLLMTAQLGDFVQVAQGPYAPPPPKKLQHMKQGDKIKGVTDKFFFLMNNCWHASNSTVLLNDSSKTVEYPKDEKDNLVGDVDLNVVTLNHLRGKAGPSGFSIELIVSQSEGVLASLTEYHFLRKNKLFGVSGTHAGYYLDIYPDVKFTRPTIRAKLNQDYKLARAVNITSELLQLSMFHRQYNDIICEPKVLYEDIKNLGYDWNVILETRGWWCPEDDRNPIKFLSILDLLKMRTGEYRPYWMK